MNAELSKAETQADAAARSGRLDDARRPVEAAAVAAPQRADMCRGTGVSPDPGGL